MSIILTKKAMGVELGVEFGVVSKYKLRVFKPDSGFVVQESGWSKNIVPTSGLNMALSGGSHASGDTTLTCQVGTGNATPAMADTSLQAPFGPRVTGTNPGTHVWQTVVEPFWRKTTVVFRFAAGTFNNTNITEVATSEVFGSQLLYSRALVVDAVGNPTAVTLASDEALDVIWEHYVVASRSTGTFNQVIDGVSTAFNFTTSPALMLDGIWWDSWATSRSAASVFPNVSQAANSCAAFHSCTDIGAPTAGNPQGGIFNGWMTSTAGSPTFVPGSGQRHLRLHVPLPQGNNAAGINGFHFDLRHHRFNMFITPPVMKVDTKAYHIDVSVALGNAALPE